MITEGLNIAPEAPQPPKVSVIEPKGGNKDTERVFSYIPDNRIRRPEEMKPLERTDEFERAYNAIVGNEKLEILVIKGIKGNNNALAERTNKVTELCISLSDLEIDNITRSFNENLRRKSDLYIQKYNLSSEEAKYLIQGVKLMDGGRRIYLFDSVGVKAVTAFVRARKDLHMAEPRTVPAFYFENHLDVAYKIDLVEMLEGEDGIILNLIQIKSHEYTGAEIEKYTQAHREWINGNTVNLENYERNFSSEPADKATLERFMNNVDELDNVFIDILSGDVAFSKDVLFEKLGLGTRPNVEKIWILKQYLPLLEKEIERLQLDGYLNEENTPLVQKAFDEIRDQLQKVENKKKNLNGISEVYSICATGTKEVSKVKIFEATGNQRKAIKVEKTN